MISVISYKQILALSLLGIIIFPSLVCRIFQKHPKIEVFNILPNDIILDSVKRVTAQGSSVAQTLKKQLDDEFENLLNKLKSEFSLPEQAWQNRLNLLERMKQSDTLFCKNPIVKSQAGDTPFIKKTRELLASYNIDPQAVIIESIHDPENASYAFVGQYCKGNKVIHFLKLNLAQLPKQSPIIQEALLRHEIMHLLNYDSLTCTFIEGLLQQHGITPEEFWANDAFSQFNKFMEFRADLMASAQISTAQALKDSFMEHMNHYDDDIPCRTHPSCKSRYVALDNLIQYMNAENQLKLA